VPSRYVRAQQSDKNHWTTTNSCDPKSGLFNACLYHAFLSHVIPQAPQTQSPEAANVIVTLNYDLVLEQAVKAFPKTRLYYGDQILSGNAKLGSYAKVVLARLPPKHTQVLPVLKLHGSLNWYDNTADETRDPQPPFEKISSLWDPENHAELDEKRDLGFKGLPLIPPTWRKGAGPKTIFHHLVSQAIQHLQTASRIVIIGYSMPETDQYFRYILAQGLRTPELPHIQVWAGQNSRPHIEARLNKLFGARGRQQWEYKDTGLQGFVQTIGETG
jgi:hypothetical protein